MRLLAIDPGNALSAYVLYDVEEARPVLWEKMPNEDMRCVVGRYRDDLRVEVLAIEMVASYGMPVGREVFDTCVWIGRFAERWGTEGDVRMVYRSDVKLHLTNSRRSKDPNVRQALLDKFGPGKELAVGKKASPGPLYGLTGDCWSALGVAVTAAETADVKVSA
jgi:hypothetical protein